MHLIMIVKIKFVASSFINCLVFIDFVHSTSLQRTTITPHHSGNGRDGGQSPVPTKREQILDPIGSRVIRIREPVTRPPELPSSHPIRPYQPQHDDRSRLLSRVLGRRGGHGSNQDKGKGKEKVTDHEASTSKSNGDQESDWFRGSTSSRHKSSRQLKKEGEAVGKAIATVVAAGAKVAEESYRAGQRVYRKVKETCNAACQRARARVNQIRARFRRPEPARRPRSPENSSMVGLVGHRQGELRGWMHSSRKTDVRPATSSAFRNTVQRPNYHHYDSNDSGSSIHGPVPLHQPHPDPSTATSSESSESASSVLHLVENIQGGSRTRSGRVYNRLDQHQ